ncbi:MAG: hypothetical protein K0R51_683 [Cytophagaceae bacterium]|nr:hypothetical protein [Cytophagaceae bacterium]
MKHLLKSVLVLALAGLTIVACKKKEDDPAPSSSEATLEGNITSNMTLDASKTYMIKGKVYVQDGVTLTIPAGTILKGQKSSLGTLIINRGAKLMAEGTASNPIVFTSEAGAGFRDRGDWGGIVMLGRGKQNKVLASPFNVAIEGITASGTENGTYGAGTGTLDDANNAGSLKFVRIEYAGVVLSDNNELNSLTLGAVGSGSTFENIQVSYANDDAIECFGGSANFKYVVIVSTNDDDLDTDQGYTGAMQYGLVIRDPRTADFSGARVWESSSAGVDVAPVSKPLFSNFTVLGPLVYNNNSVAASSSGLDADYRAAVEFNSGSEVEVHNSIILGFADQINPATAGGKVQNCVFGFNGGDLALTGVTGCVVDSLENLYGSDFAAYRLGANATTEVGAPTNNVALRTNAVLGWTTPAPLLNSSSTYKAGAPNVSGASSFFANEAYYGAFGTAANSGWNWTSGWLEFDPNNEAY